MHPLFHSSPVNQDRCGFRRDGRTDAAAIPFSISQKKFMKTAFDKSESLQIIA